MTKDCSASQLFIELQVQYMKISSSEHVFCFDIENNLCTQHDVRISASEKDLFVTIQFGKS